METIKLKQAIRLSTIWHKGQKRNFSDTPYITHPLRVMRDVGSTTQKIIAVLHDVLEDTDATQQDIRYEFGDEITNKVLKLTHENGVSYLDYIKIIMEDEDCIAVKIADILDNLTDSPSPRMVEKGAKALEILINK